MNQPIPESPFVVQYAEIPVIPERRSRLESRPFVAERLLGAVVPRQGVTLELIEVPPGEEVAARRATSRSLLIVLQGRAELVAGSRSRIRVGDVVAIPANFAYGITAA